MAFLIFAFAQPINKNEDNDLELNDSVLIYVDNSLSMSMPIGSQQSALDMAFSFADNIVSNYPEDAKFKLLENNYSNSLGISYSGNTIRDRLTELTISSVSRSLDEIHQRILSSGFQGDVYLISDFQTERDFDFSGFQTDTLRTFYFLPIDVQSFSNVHFDTAYLENTFLLDGLKNVLKVNVKNEGEEDLQQVNLKLYLGDQLSGTANLDINANSAVLQEFEIDRQASGLDKVRLELDDNSVFFDNNLFLTLNNIDKLNVMVVRESSSSRFVERLFSENELFNLETANAGNLDLSRITESDLIILNEINTLSNQLIGALSDFLDRNGSVVVIPNEANTRSSYSNLGLRLTSDSRERLELDPPDLQNPFFEGIFEEDNVNIDTPSGSTVLRLRNINSTILKFKNGRAFLSKAERSGNLFFFSCSFQETRTSFPSHSLFVPVMYKLALGSSASLNTLYYSTDTENIEYPITSEFSANTIVNLNRENVSITPDQRVSGDKLLMVIPKGQITEGQFEIEAGDQSIGAISFNNPKAESGLQRISRDDIDVATSTVDHMFMIEASSGVEVNNELTAGVIGESLWKYAIILSLSFLFVEIILIRYL